MLKTRAHRIGSDTHRTIFCEKNQPRASRPILNFGGRVGAPRTGPPLAAQRSGTRRASLFAKHCPSAVLGDNVLREKLKEFGECVAVHKRHRPLPPILMLKTRAHRIDSDRTIFCEKNPPRASRPTLNFGGRVGAPRTGPHVAAQHSGNRHIDPLAKYCPLAVRIATFGNDSTPWGRGLLFFQMTTPPWGVGVPNHRVL